VNESELRETLSEIEQRLGNLENLDNNAFVHELGLRVEALEQEHIPIVSNEYKELLSKQQELQGMLLFLQEKINQLYAKKRRKGRYLNE